MGSGKVFSKREIEEEIFLLNCELCGKEDLFLHATIVKNNQYYIVCPDCLDEILAKIKKAGGGEK